MIIVERDWKGWSDLPKPREGNTGKYQKYQDYLYELVSELKPNRILEVGFNAGHSCCCFFNAYPETKITTFDICRHGTEKPGVESLQKNGFDIELIEGSSEKTIPTYFNDNSDTYDFIFIDGCHHGEIPRHDMENTIPRLNINGIVVVDDFNLGSVGKCFKSIDWSAFKEESVPKIEKSIKVMRKVK